MKKVDGFVLLSVVLVCLVGVGVGCRTSEAPRLDGGCNCREPQLYWADFIEKNEGGGSNAAARALLQCGETQRAITVMLDDDTPERELVVWTRLARKFGVPQITFRLPGPQLDDYLEPPHRFKCCPVHYEIACAVAYFNQSCEVQDFNVAPLTFANPEYPVDGQGMFNGGPITEPLMLSSDAFRPGGRVAFASVYMRLKGNPALAEHGVEAMSDEVAGQMMERLRAIAEDEEFPLPIFIRDSWTGKVRFIIAPHGKSLTVCDETPEELIPPPDEVIFISSFVHKRCLHEES